MSTHHKDQATGPKLRVAIFEDNRHAATGMAVELSEAEDIEVVKATADSDEILGLVAEAPLFDVAFIDLQIGGDMTVGAALIKQIKAIAPEVKCIVLTAFPELPNFLAAFDAGAEGFVRKGLPLAQQPSLIELVRQVAAGGRYYDPMLVGEMRQYLDVGRLPVINKERAEAEPNPLTKREQELLEELAKRHTNAQIGENLSIAINTVKTHLRSIKLKLGAKDRHEAVLIAMARGWLGGAPAERD